MSRENPAIVWELAASMFRVLSGYQGYPKPIDSPGERHFIRAFQESVLSVEHAQAVIDSFDQDFPTILRIRESAHKLRARFEPDPVKEREWEKQYGKPDPEWSKNLTGSYLQQKRRMAWQAIRDSVYYTEGPGRFLLTAIDDYKARTADIKFWANAMKRACKEHPEELAAFRKQLEERGWDELRKEDWASEVQPVIEPPREFTRITQADIDQARNRKALARGEREPGDGE